MLYRKTMTPDRNLPPGCSLRQVEQAAGDDSENLCAECGGYLQTMTEIDLQLCARHLQLVMEHLPET